MHQRQSIRPVQSLISLCLLNIHCTLHDNKTLFYMKHALYRLDKTKIAFEKHCQINAKLF